MSYTSAVLADSPLGFWLFDVPDGTDSSGNSHTATISAGASFASGSGINASINGRLSVTSTSTANVTMPVAVSGTAWTYEFWIKTTATVGGILGSRDVAADPGIEVTLGNSGFCGSNGQITVGFNTNGVYRGVASTVTVNDGNWHHVVCIWSGTAGVAITSAQFSIYVDGVNVTGSSGGTGTGPNAPITGDAAGWVIGSRHLLSSSILMDVDGVACYNTALAAARIVVHYSEGNNVFADAFANAGAITGTSYTLSGIDTTSWTLETGEPGGMSHTGWATFTPTTTTLYRLDTIGSNYDTLLAIYTGTTLGALTLVASDDNSGGSGTSKITNLSLTAGTTYHVQVGAQPAGTGGLLCFFFAQESTDRLGALAVETLASSTPGKNLGAISAEVLVGSTGTTSNNLGALTIEVLVSNEQNFIGWGMPQ